MHAKPISILLLDLDIEVNALHEVLFDYHSKYPLAQHITLHACAWGCIYFNGEIPIHKWTWYLPEKDDIVIDNSYSSFFSFLSNNLDNSRLRCYSVK